MSLNYHILENFPLLDTRFVDEALNANYFVPGPQNIELKIKISIAQSSFAETDFYKHLQEKFGANECFYLRFSPNGHYDWHRDIHRNCAINIAIEQYPNNVTLFRKYVSELNYEFEKLDYPARRPVIFNTDIEHCVYNCTKNYRYLLSLSFPPEVTFDSLKEELANYLITSY
jgi:hypothetical protein